MATTTATQIQQLYVGLLGRAADQGGLNWWADQVTTGGKTLEDVRASFVTSTEYTTTYGAAATRADLVTSIYQNLFERTPSADEVKYWAETDTRPADQLVAAFIEFAGAADQAVINNKTFVAQTYTDTVGTNFSAAAAASVIANVDGTTASVNTALTSISAGTLPGLVPGVSLINAVAAANAAVTDLQKASFGTNPTFDGIADANNSNLGFGNAKNSLVTADEARDAQQIAQTARDAVSGKATATLSTELATANSNLANAKSIAQAGGLSAKISAYDAAVVAQKVLVGDTAAVTAKAAVTAATAHGEPGDADYTPAVVAADAVVAKTAVQAATEAAGTAATVSLAATNAALGTSGAATNYVKLTAAFGKNVDATTLKDQLNGIASTQKTALITELQKLGTVATSAIDAVAKEKALLDANSAVSTAKTGDIAAYTSAAEAVVAANDSLIKANAADAAVVVAKTVVDKFAALDTSTAVANAALEAFKTANIDKVLLSDASLIENAGTFSLATAKSDVFYFGSKINGADFTIGGSTTNNFGAGDSIVLGTGYTFNSGALSTGNNNALEVFFVKGSTGTQVVIETEAFGSAATGNVVDTNGNITDSPSATVINLVGVTADHLSVANGVISYV